MTGWLAVNTARILRLLATAGWMIGFLCVSPSTAVAEPSPYPSTEFILKYYDRVEFTDYFSNSAGGVWFSTPLGLTCGIWDRGSFGCIGDIRGAPPGTRNIGWVNGNIVTRWDPLLGIQTPPGTAQRDLEPRSYIDYNGTTCATMADTSTFCTRGVFKFFVTSTRTWVSPP